MLLLFLDYGNHVPVPAILRQGVSGRGIAMRIDAFPGVRTRLHQQARHLDVPPQHRKVQRAMFIVGRHIHADQFRPSLQQHAHLSRIAALHRLSQSVYVGAIHKGF